MVSRELLNKFKMIYKEEFDVTITDEEATEMSTELVNLMKVLFKPDPVGIEEDSSLEEGEPNEAGGILNK